MYFVKQPLKRRSHKPSALVGDIHSKTCKWRESCNSRLLTLKFLAPYVFNGNREPGKMDNLLVSDTSTSLSHSLLLPVKAKPRLEGWIQTLCEELNCRRKPEIPGNSSKCLETASLCPIYALTAQWGASGAFMEQLYAPESKPWFSGSLRGSRRSGTVLCWHSHGDPPPACSTASSSAIPIQTDCWDLHCWQKKPKQNQKPGRTQMEIVQVETKGITWLAKHSLFHLTALRSLQHNSSLSSPLLSSPLRHHLPSKILGSSYLYAFKIRKAQDIPRSKIIIFYKHIQQTY